MCAASAKFRLLFSHYPAGIAGSKLSLLQSFNSHRFIAANCSLRNCRSSHNTADKVSEGQSNTEGLLDMFYCLTRSFTALQTTARAYAAVTCSHSLNTYTHSHPPPPNPSPHPSHARTHAHTHTHTGTISVCDMA